MLEDYDDDYPTCARTYLALNIYHDALDPGKVTGLLGIEPSYSQVTGQPISKRSGKKFTPPIGLWSLSTKDVVASRDVRRHIDWILDRFAGKDDALKQLQAEGHRMNVSCYWVSAEGHGGPMLSPVIMARLGELGIELWFDFYGPYE